MAKGSSLLRDAVARCASWEDFVRHLQKRPEKEKGDLFEHLVRAYLQLDPEYATKLRKVWLLDDVPAALRKRLIFLRPIKASTSSRRQTPENIGRSNANTGKTPNAP